MLLFLFQMKRILISPTKDSSKSFLFAADHCFAIKGQGTVVTGTVLQGSLKIGDVSKLC